MYPYPQSVTPAVRMHIDAQTAFLNEVSQTVARSWQQVFQLNMQLGQTLVEETTNTAQRMLTTEQAGDVLAAASRAQPATEKLRSYQRQLSQLAATAQVDLTRLAEQHGQKTSRTARALADEVMRASVEETDKCLRQQEEVVKTSRDAFRQEAERSASSGAQFAGNLQRGTEAAAAKSDDQPRQPSGTGNVQGSNGQAGNKGASSSR